MYYLYEEGEMLPQIISKMKNVNRLPQDEILELMHNRYLEEMRESGLPAHYADMYGYGPLCFLNDMEEEIPPAHEKEDEPLLKVHTCHKCGVELEPDPVMGFATYCSLLCAQHDQI